MGINALKYMAIFVGVRGGAKQNLQQQKNDNNNLQFSLGGKIPKLLF